MTLYVIHNTVSNKYYIGKTEKPLAERWAIHVRDANRGLKFHISCSIRKYGPEVFRIYPLMELASRTELNRWEKDLIALFRARDHEVGYNEAFGGDGGVMPAGIRVGRRRGTKQPLHAIIMTSSKNKGKKRTKAVRLKLAAICRRISAARKGIPATAAQKLNLVKGRVKGKRWTHHA